MELKDLLLRNEATIYGYFKNKEEILLAVPYEEGRWRK
jgi:hypothetical protein